MHFPRNNSFEHNGRQDFQGKTTLLSVPHTSNITWWGPFISLTALDFYNVEKKYSAKHLLCKKKNNHTKWVSSTQTNKTKVPVGKDSPSSLESSVWTRQGRPSQRNQSLCNHNLDWYLLSYRHGFLDTAWNAHMRDSDCQKLTMQLLLENHVWREDNAEVYEKIDTCFLPSITAFPTDHRIFLSWLDIIITYMKKKNTIHKRTYTKLRCIRWFVQ